MTAATSSRDSPSRDGEEQRSASVDDDAPHEHHSDFEAGQKSVDNKPGVGVEAAPDTDKHPLAQPGQRNFEARYRRKWYQIHLPKDPPHPPPSSLDGASIVPDVSASWLSLITFQYMTPLMVLGFQRPLETTDLWKLDGRRSAAHLSGLLDRAWQKRQARASLLEAEVREGKRGPGLLTKLRWRLGSAKESLFHPKAGTGTYAQRAARWRDTGGDGEFVPSLVWAVHDVFKWRIWSGLCFKVIGDTLQITSPLVSKAIINFGKDAYAHHVNPSLPKPNTGHGIGLAFALFFMMVGASLCHHQFFYRGMSTGVLTRGALISAIYERSLRLSGKARTTLTNGKLVNHISTDVSRIDFASGWFTIVFAAPIQMIICLIILLTQLGPSALSGYGFFVLVTPLQTRTMAYLFRYRRKAMIWTDKRAKLIQELLSSMRIVKFFAYEDNFLKRLGFIRGQELKNIRNLLILRSANNAVAFSLPILAAVISFCVYAINHTLDPAIIFSSLLLFQLLRMPLIFLPLTLSAITDARNAFERLQNVFLADTLPGSTDFDPESEYGVVVEDGRFQWEQVQVEEDAAAKKMAQKEKKWAGRMDKDKKKDKGRKKPEKMSGTSTPVTVAGGATKGSGEPMQETPSEPFQLQGINLKIPKGQLCAIVGPVGNGKSSLLQALVGEMKKLQGRVVFGGSVGYCSQTAWIQNATLRDNILFGRPFDEDRYWRVIRDALLEADLEMLPNGDLTEIGEKGINLSGGQKQRVNIARALYYDADVVCLDDPLSAVDAHVGKALFRDAIKGALKAKTVVLVTHALHFLPQVDYIYTVVNGSIAEQGTYAELIANQGPFSQLMEEFGGEEEEAKKDEEEEEEAAVEETGKEVKRPDRSAMNGKAGGPGLMQEEERNTGAVSWAVYSQYIRAANGLITVPLCILSLALMQVTTILNSYFLVWWQENSFHLHQGAYMGIYASLGVAMMILAFLVGSCMSVLSYFSCANLHRAAITRVMRAPMAWFDVTPIGRIMNRFSKDVDTLDNMLADAIRMASNTFASVIGSIILITIVAHYFVIAVAVVIVFYWYAALFYRSSARELKRLDAILRSSLYGHFSESLTGLSTIRAYGEEGRFVEDNRKYMDIENRAYYMTITNQRWLGVRLDFLGALLTLIVAIIATAGGSSIPPGQIGVALTYVIQLAQVFGFLTRQVAEVENDMNSCERVLHFANTLEQEAPYEIEATKPPPEWPSRGEVVMKNVVMSYRPGLAPVLKGISMHVRAGEKIGIVGRTGAGKSSIMIALFRLVELTSGSIVIDGVDIGKIGLRDLRQKLSIIPQDPLLFSGTIRSNLDPFNEYDDSRLWDALKRAYLVDSNFDPSAATKPAAVTTEKAAAASEGRAFEARTSAVIPRLTLETAVEDEGVNLSVGERSLVSLARALVKDSQVIVLDEATASVDLETDAKIQETIRREFADKTLLCIAHRLRTILAYDRILVLSEGRVEEFDTPLNLFLRADSIFRSMCEKSGVTREDVEKSRLDRWEER